MLSERIKARRDALGLSQETLARISGVSLRAVQSIESGETQSPRVGTAVALSRALGVSVSELLDEDATEATE